MVEGAAMTCREIADDFIVAIGWTWVTREESLRLVSILEEYPNDCFVVELYAPTTTEWDA